MADKTPKIIEKHMPAFMKDVRTGFLARLKEAINAEFCRLSETKERIDDQFFLATAEGIYIIKLAASRGFTMPENSGLDIDSFKVLAPIMVSEPKQIRSTIVELIKVFYSKDILNPSVISTRLDNFPLVDGDNLIVETERGTVNISFLAENFNDISDVSAVEITSLLNASQDLFTAVTVFDRATRRNKVNLISKTSGADAFIAVRGGTAQNVLQFDKLIETANNQTTEWKATKATSISDELIFEWTGVGTPPDIFKAKKGDIVTIRGLAEPTLNGTYVLDDVGYVYFKVKSTVFNSPAVTFTQPADDSIVFTSQEKNTLFDKAEYAFVSEIVNNTLTITVPAVPPLARRSLKGSTHLQGVDRDLLDFTRNTVTVKRNVEYKNPVPKNTFVIRTPSNPYDYLEYYKTSSVDGNTDNPTYGMEFDHDYSVLPHTLPEPIGEDSLKAEQGSEEIVVTTPFRHGLRAGWGVTISDATGQGNITPAMINTQHVVRRVLNKNQYVIRLFDSDSRPIKFDDTPFGPFDIHRLSSVQADGADFYLEFPTPADAVSSGLLPGFTFEVNPTSGTEISLFLARALKYDRILIVTSIVGNRVFFKTGLGIGTEGLIAQGMTAFRSAPFGGPDIKHHFDKASDWNQERVMDNLSIMFLEDIEPENPKFLGSYVFNPTDEKFPVTITDVIGKTDQVIFKGETRQILEITSDASFPSSGEVVFDYGNWDYEGPVKYSAFIENGNTKQLVLDASYRFKFSHLKGTSVYLIKDRKPYTPKVDGSDYPAYITGTTDARNTMFKLVSQLTAGGIFIEKNVIIPDLKYEDISLSPFS